MSYSTHTLQKAAEMVMFGALCFAAVDIVWARLESRPPEPPTVSLTSAAAAVAPPAPPTPPALQGVLTGQPRIAPPVPPPPPAVAARTPAAPRPAAAPQQPLPVLTGTLVGKGVYLGVMQANGGTAIVKTGDRVGAYIVNWVGPYKACVKDAQGKKHVLALGVGASPSSRPAVPYVAPTPMTHASMANSATMHHVAYNSAPPPPPPPPPAPVGVRGFGVAPQPPR